MKGIPAVTLILSMLACTAKPDFQKIRPGMHTREVVELVGRPASRKPMPGSDWWLYNDEQKHLLVIRNDTVVRCTTQKDAMEVMEKTLRSFDSLERR